MKTQRLQLLFQFPLLFWVCGLACPAHADTFSAIGFNHRADVGPWIDGLTARGATAGKVIRDDKPTLAALKDLFARSNEWLYLAGHYSGDRLYNQDASVGINFYPGKVVLTSGTNSEELVRGTGFKQHLKLKVLFWGGCNTQGNDATVAMLRSLFGTQVVQVGWIGTTGWEMPHLNMGGTTGGQHFDTHFFTLLGSALDPAKVKDAWLGSADKIYWGKDASNEPYRPRFAVIDATGRQHLLKGGVQTNQGLALGKQY